MSKRKSVRIKTIEEMTSDEKKRLLHAMFTFEGDPEEDLTSGQKRGSVGSWGKEPQ